MRDFLTDKKPSSPIHSLLTNFYKEEFVKHQQCLEAQREFFSEQAIKEAEAALAKIMAQLDQLCTLDDANLVVSNLLRKFDVVTRLSHWSDIKHVH